MTSQAQPDDLQPTAEDYLPDANQQKEQGEQPRANVSAKRLFPDVSSRRTVVGLGSRASDSGYSSLGSGNPSIELEFDTSGYRPPNIDLKDFTISAPKSFAQPKDLSETEHSTDRMLSGAHKDDGQKIKEEKDRLGSPEVTATDIEEKLVRVDWSRIRRRSSMEIIDQMTISRERESTGQKISETQSQVQDGDTRDKKSETQSQFRGDNEVEKWRPRFLAEFEKSPRSNNISKTPTKEIKPRGPAGSRRLSMTKADIDERNRLLAESMAQMRYEREAADEREREERASYLRQQQQTSAYWDPRGGERYPIPKDGPMIGRRGSISGRRRIMDPSASGDLGVKRVSSVQFVPQPVSMSTQQKNLSNPFISSSGPTRSTGTPALGAHGGGDSESLKETTRKRLADTEMAYQNLISSNMQSGSSDNSRSEEVLPPSRDSARTIRTQQMIMNERRGREKQRMEKSNNSRSEDVFPTIQERDRTTRIPQMIMNERRQRVKQQMEQSYLSHHTSIIGQEKKVTSPQTDSQKASQASAPKPRRQIQVLSIGQIGPFLAGSDELQSLHEKIYSNLGETAFLNAYCGALKVYGHELLKEARNGIEEHAALLLKYQPYRMIVAQHVGFMTMRSLELSARATTKNGKSLFETTAGDQKALFITTTLPAQAIKRLEYTYGTMNNIKKQDFDIVGFSKTTYTSEVKEFLQGGKAFQVLLRELRLLTLPHSIRDILECTPKHLICITTIETYHIKGFATLSKTILVSFFLIVSEVLYPWIHVSTSSMLGINGFRFMFEMVRNLALLEILKTTLLEVIIAGAEKFLINGFKASIEDYSGSEWDWWPLSPGIPRLPLGGLYLRWVYCGQSIFEIISAEEASTIRKILKASSDHPPQCVCCMTTESFSGNGYKTLPQLENTVFGRIRQRVTTFLKGGSIRSVSAQGGPSRAQQLYTPSSPGAASALSSTNTQTTTGSTSSITSSITSDGSTQASSTPPSSVPTTPLSNPLCVVFGIKDSWDFDTIENIDIPPFLNDPLFFQELKTRHNKHLGCFRRWFSPFRFAYCNFVQFEAIDTGQIYSCGEALPEDHGYASHYEYSPRPPGAKNPLIDRKLFSICLKACTPNCSLSILPTPLHKCRHLPLKSHKWKRIPRKKGEFNMKSTQAGEIAFGLEAEYALSFAVLLCYHVIPLFSSSAFWAYWMVYHPDDLQNASIPTFTVMAFIMAFWAYLGMRNGQMVSGV